MATLIEPDQDSTVVSSQWTLSIDVWVAKQTC
jgi:hypothetical protein